jgi:aspartyl-tRNA(Asn)/glutamyl-tRNA(Gln) amidotransferase subunit B
MAEWESVIGLEVHVQLATRSKLFSGASTEFGAEPNTQACPVDIALPGVLPVLNAEALRMAVTFGLAIGAEISRHSVFDRKNYPYPDLPKGYQISQFAHPIVGPGTVEVRLADDTKKTIGITRAHLEEDAGKSLHEDYQGMTGVDLNRSGIPLLEIVSEPDLRSAEEAVAYLRQIHALVRYLGISDAKMAEGSLRCDANVSVRPRGSDELGERTEIKNLNSFRFIERALNFEIERQRELLERGEKVERETLQWDEQYNETRPMRGKEFSDDYRYFPDPDLLPVVLDEAFIAEVAASLPELADEKRARFQADYGLSEYDARYLTTSRETADYFETVVKGADPTLAANWMMGELAAALNREEMEIEDCPVAPEQLAKLIARINDETLSGRTAKTVFEALWNREGDVDEIIEARGLEQLSDSGELEALVADVIAKNPTQVEQFRAGRERVLGFFVGQIMKATQGKANPKQVNELLRKKLTAR